MAFVEMLEDGPVEYFCRPEHPNDLQFTISGKCSPFVDVMLAPGQGIMCEAGSVVLHDKPVEFRGGVEAPKRLLINGAANETARLVLAAGCNGKLGAFELAEYGSRLLCPAPALVAAGPGVSVTTYARYNGIAAAAGEEDLAILLLEGEGWVFLRAMGDVLETRIGPGDEKCVQAAHIAALSPTIDVDPVACDDEIGLVTLTGPGTAWLQSGRMQMPLIMAPAKEHDDAAPPIQIRPGALARRLNGAA